MADYDWMFEPAQASPQKQVPLAPSAVDQAPKGQAVAPAFTRDAAIQVQTGNVSQEESEDLSQGDVFKDLEAIIAKPEIGAEDRKVLKDILRESRGENASRDEVITKVLAEQDKRLNPLQRAAEKTIVGRALGRGGIEVGNALLNAPLRVAGLFGVEEADEIADRRNEAVARMALLDKVRTDHSATAAIFGDTIANGVDLLANSGAKVVFGGALGKMASSSQHAAAYGTAALFGASAADNALTDVRGREDLSDLAKYSYAAGMGGIEAGVMLAFGMLGGGQFGGLENASLKGIAGRVQDITTRTGVRQAALALGKASGGEGAEEALTQLAQNAWGTTFDMQDDIYEGVKEAGILGAITGGLANVPGAVSSGLIKSLKNTEAAVKADVEAVKFIKNNPEADLDAIRNSKNRAEFEALTGMTKTSEQFRRNFKESLASDNLVLEEENVEEQVAIDKAKDAKMREAQGTPLPEADPQTDTETAKVMAARAAENIKQAHNPPPESQIAPEIATQMLERLRENQKNPAEAEQEVIGPNGEKFRANPYDQDLTPKQQEMVRDLLAQGVNLTTEQVKALHNYLNEGYEPINRALRGIETTYEQLNPPTPARIEAVKKAVRSMPTYEGTAYRGTKLASPAFAEFRNNLVPGARFVDEGFASSSRKLSVAQSFAGYGSQYDPTDNAIIFRIQSNKGHDMTSIASVAEEAEVLFEPGTEFEVVAVRNIKEDGSAIEVTLRDLGAPNSATRQQVEQETFNIQRDIEGNPGGYSGGVGMLHAAIDELRSLTDLSTLTSKKQMKWAEAREQAINMLQAGEIWPRDIAETIRNGERKASDLSQVEHAAFSVRMAQLKVEYQNVSKVVGSLKDTGDTNAIGQASARMDRILSEVDILTDVGRRAGSEFGALLNQQKLLLNDNLGFVEYRGRMRAAKKGVLSDEDNDFGEYLSTKWEEIQRKLSEAETKFDKEVGDRFVKQAKKTKAAGDKKALMDRLRELLDNGCDLI